MYAFHLSSAFLLTLTLSCSPSTDSGGPSSLANTAAAHVPNSSPETWRLPDRFAEADPMCTEDRGFALHREETLILGAFVKVEPMLKPTLIADARYPGEHSQEECTALGGMYQSGVRILLRDTEDLATGEMIGDVQLVLGPDQIGTWGGVPVMAPEGHAIWSPDIEVGASMGAVVFHIDSIEGYVSPAHLLFSVGGDKRVHFQRPLNPCGGPAEAWDDLPLEEIRSRVQAQRAAADTSSAAWPDEQLVQAAAAWCYLYEGDEPDLRCERDEDCPKGYHCLVEDTRCFENRSRDPVHGRAEK